jgi:hypothetical protein
MLNLNCWVLGDDPRRIFSVELQMRKRVDALKDAIKNKIKPEFNHVTANWSCTLEGVYLSDLILFSAD